MVHLFLLNFGSQLSDSCLYDNFLLNTIDLPGHGNSGWSTNPKRDYSLKGMGNILADVINGINLEEYMIVTLSFSGNLIGECVNNLKDCTYLESYTEGRKLW